jgi:tetratricopeptide (TPR) repeat protein
MVSGRGIAVTTRRFFGNPQFLTYARHLRKLHELIRTGADESEEGESLRDRMDEPAEYLTREEVDFLNGVSADFYTLSGPASPIRANPPAVLQDDLKGALDAQDAGDFAKALGLLRKNEAYLDPAYVAWLRGNVWSKAGESDIAEAFFQRAKNLTPQNESCAVGSLDAPISDD